MNKIVRSASATLSSIKRSNVHERRCYPSETAGDACLAMTEHIVHSSNPDGSLLLRELNHRVRNELTSAICAISAKAVQSDSVPVKAALLDVVDLLHRCSDVHRALNMPDHGRLTEAARYLQQLCFSITKYRLDILAIRVIFSANDMWLEGERCWKLGLVVSELLTNVARHAI